MAAKFELKKTTNDKFVFNLLASNGQVILTSETYDSHAGALQGIESVNTAFTQWNPSSVATFSGVPKVSVHKRGIGST